MDGERLTRPGLAIAAVLLALAYLGVDASAVQGITMVAAAGAVAVSLGVGVTRCVFALLRSRQQPERRTRPCRAKSNRDGGRRR